MLKSRKLLTLVSAALLSTGLVLPSTAHAIIQVAPSEVDKSFIVAELDNYKSSAPHAEAVTDHIEIPMGHSELTAQGLADIAPHAGDDKAMHPHDTDHADAADAHYDAHHGDDHGTGGLPQFDPTWFASQIFWLAIAFLAMYFFFSKKALPEIASGLNSRETQVKTDLENAEKISEQANAVKDDYEAKLQNARDKATGLINSAQEDIKTKSSESINAFRQNQDKLIANLENKISAAKDEAMADMKVVAADTAKEAAAKIIDHEADIGDVKSVVEKINKAA